MTNNYDQLDVLAMAELIEQKKTSPSELVEEAIRRAEAINPQLNAIVHRLYEDARTAAQQDWSNTPFKGVPFVLKDLLAAYAGAPLRSGSSFMGDYTPTEDGELVKRYRAAGLIPIVKSNTPEMGLTPYTEPTAFGTTVNPWNIDHSSGGSSGGSAALVAAGVIPAAHGGDGGGSIRIPSSCCGLFGLKPTHGRTPNNIDYESWHGFATEHVLTRTVRDSAAILDATCAPDPANPAAPKPPAESFLSQVDTPTGRLKIAYSAHPMMGGKVSSESQAALEATVKLCRDQGHELVEATPKIDGVAFARAFVIMLCGQTRADIEVMGRLVGKKPSAQQFEPSTWSLGLLGTKYTASMYASAFQTIQATVRGVHRFMSEYDIFLTPTLALPPIKNGALQVQGAELTAMRVLGSINAKNLLYAATSIDDIADQIFAYMPYTPLFNATGQPAMSMPLYWSADNLPIGLQFVGRYADESTLFRIAGQLERAQSWHDRRPQIYAS